MKKLLHGLAAAALVLGLGSALTSAQDSGAASCGDSTSCSGAKTVAADETAKGCPMAKAQVVAQKSTGCCADKAKAATVAAEKADDPKVKCGEFGPNAGGETFCESPGAVDGSALGATGAEACANAEAEAIANFMNALAGEWLPDNPVDCAKEEECPESPFCKQAVINTDASNILITPGNPQPVYIFGVLVSYVCNVTVSHSGCVNGESGCSPCDPGIA